MFKVKNKDTRTTKANGIIPVNIFHTLTLNIQLPAGYDSPITPSVHKSDQTHVTNLANVA